MKIEKIADKKNKDKYYIFFIGKFSNFFFFFIFFYSLQLFVY